MFLFISSSLSSSLIVTIIIIIILIADSLYFSEMIKSDKSVDINLKVLTEKDILIEGLRTELGKSYDR